MGCYRMRPNEGNALWDARRDEYPASRRLVYLNHAAVAPLCRAAAEAMQGLAREVLEEGARNFYRWLQTYEGLRVAAAAMIGANKREIAIVKNTSEGLATIANGIDWKPGDRVVGFREEFPANYFPWRHLEKRGVTVEWLSASGPLEQIDEACRGARLLAISFVQYLSGYRADLESIGEICARRGCLFVVDAIQGLGAFPVDVRKCRIDALAADGHKWLTGPEGCGILYVREGLQDQIEPTEIGWTNFASQEYGNRDMTLRSDAARYECGTLNTIGCYGLKAAIEYLCSVGIERIGAEVQALADRLAEGVHARGWEILGTRTPANGAGIVSFRRADVDSRVVVRRLREASIEAAPRQGWVRASPHFYVLPEEIDRTLEVLDCLD
ncbi:MAG: aminotransferase class V-fold PLP-dependent enzyme [bacterium]